MPGQSVVYLRKGSKKTHIFTKDGLYWRAICNPTIIFRNAHPGKPQDADCKVCIRCFRPDKHLYH